MTLTNISMISVLPPAAARCSGDLCGGPVLQGGRKLSTMAGSRKIFVRIGLTWRPGWRPPPAAPARGRGGRGRRRGGAASGSGHRARPGGSPPVTPHMSHATPHMSHVISAAWSCQRNFVKFFTIFGEGPFMLMVSKDPRSHLSLIKFAEKHSVF